MADLWKLFTATVDDALGSAFPYASTATLDFPFADAAAVAVQGIIPQRLDTIKYLIGLLMSYPMGAVLGLVATHVQSPFLYHLLNAATGIAMAMWVFGPAWTVLLMFAGVAYIILAIAGNIKPLRKNLGAIMMLYAITVMSIIHLHRIHVDYMGWSLDVSGPCMILTIKLTSLAFNMSDSLSVDSYTAELKVKPNRIKADRIKLAVVGTPDILQYLGWVFCAPALLAGPAAEYKQYEVAAKGVSIPWSSRIRAGLSKFVAGLVFFGLTAYLGGVLPRGNPEQGDITVMPNSYLAMPFLQRAFWTWMLLGSFRFKYYGAWKLGEGAVNMAGIGYAEAHKEGGGKEGNWDDVCAMDVLGFEFAPNMAAALRAWNMRTQNWLAKYVYTRTPAWAATYATYTLSALWHGFYPGYYFTFLSAPLFSAVDKALTTRVRPLVQGSPALALVYDVVGRLVASIALSYTVLPFQALGYKESVAAWQAFSYAGHVVAVVALAVLYLGFKEPKKQVKTA